MTHLEIFENALRAIGVTFVKAVINGYTYIVMVNPNDNITASDIIDLKRDKSWEFDEAGELGSYP